VAAVNGRVVPLDLPVPVVGSEAEVRLILAPPPGETRLHVVIRCVVPLVDGRETVVGSLA
jgi:hypothetical protein